MASRESDDAASAVGEFIGVVLIALMSLTVVLVARAIALVVRAYSNPRIPRAVLLMIALVEGIALGVVLLLVRAGSAQLAVVLGGAVTLSGLAVLSGADYMANRAEVMARDERFDDAWWRHGD